jgi:hypothetical protein
MVASVALVVNDPERERSKGRKREREQRPALMQSAVRKSVRSRRIATCFSGDLLRVFALSRYRGALAHRAVAPPSFTRWAD